jgi:hypothetical protein
MDRAPEPDSDDSMNGEDESDQNKVLFNLAMSQYSKFFKKSLKKQAVSMFDTRKVLEYKDAQIPNKRSQYQRESNYRGDG